MNIKNKGGIVLLIALAFLVLFLTMAVLHISTTTSDLKVVKRTADSLRAFSLAESGVQKALYEIRKDFSWAGEGPLPISWNGSDKGEYEVIVTDIEDGKKRIVSTGYFPRKSGEYAKRSIEAEISPSTPNNFYDNAIFAGEDVDLNGNYSVNGNILYGESINPAGLGQEFEGDFPLLNFEQIRAIAVSQVNGNGQNNLYTQADIDNNKPFPTSFWFDEALGIPNVVYVETNLVLRGNVGTLGGFYVVAGDVITNADAEADTTINGNGSIDGCVYTLGDFRINGGGSGLGVTGGVWGRDEVRLNGNATVTYDGGYMDAIRGLNIGFVAQITSWKEDYS